MNGNKIRNSLVLANADPFPSLLVHSFTTLTMAKFDEEFGTGEKNIISKDNSAECNRHHAK
jgi:hypothetical protein